MDVNVQEKVIAVLINVIVLSAGKSVSLVSAWTAFGTMGITQTAEMFKFWRMNINWLG